MEITRIDDTEQLRLAAGEKLNSLMAQHANGPILFLTEGEADTLAILNQDTFNQFGNHLSISILDENLTTDPLTQNFTQLQTTHFLKAALAQGSTVIDPGINPSDGIDDAAINFESMLHFWHNQNPNGTVIVAQGIGADGSTAGIVPFPEDTLLFETLFDQPDQWACGHDATGKKATLPLRITVTCEFLREQVHHAVVCIAGREKNSVLNRIQVGAGDRATTPGRILHEMADVHLFTDIG